MWASYVIAIDSIGFILMLSPLLFNRELALAKAGLGTGLLLVAQGTALIGLHAVFGAIMTFITGILWLYIAQREFRRGKT